MFACVDGTYRFAPLSLGTGGSLPTVSRCEEAPPVALAAPASSRSSSLVSNSSFDGFVEIPARADAPSPVPRCSPVGVHGLHRNQLYGWRRELRSAAVGRCRRSSVPDFVPVVAEGRVGSGAAAIEIEIGGAIVRAGAGVELAFLGKVLRLLKATK